MSDADRKVTSHKNATVKRLEVNRTKSQASLMFEDNRPDFMSLGNLKNNIKNHSIREKTIQGKAMQRFLNIAGQSIRSGMIINESQRPKALEQELVKYELPIRFKLYDELRMLALDNNQHEFESWESITKCLTEPKIFIRSEPGGITLVKSPSDLLIWLISNPISSKLTPIHFSNIKLLVDVLDTLGGIESRTNFIEAQMVWNVLIRTVETKKGLSDGTFPIDFYDEDSTKKVGKFKWSVGEWNKEKQETDLMRGGPGSIPSLKEPARFRRKLPPEIYALEIKKINEKLAGYKFVGIHATRIESTGTLVKEGISQDRFDTNHHLGKGAGFYIVPINGKMNKGIRDAVFSWGSHFVGVYLPNECQLIKANEGENVQTLEQEYGAGQCYYSFGKLEEVIPPSLCNRAILISNPDDISMAPSGYEVEKDDGDPFRFLQEIKPSKGM